MNNKEKIRKRPRWDDPRVQEALKKIIEALSKYEAKED